MEGDDNNEINLNLSDNNPVIQPVGNDNGNENILVGSEEKIPNEQPKNIELKEDIYHTLKIENFLEVCRKFPFKEKKYFSCPNFFLPPEYEWKIRLFPNGNSKEGYIGIFLVPVGEPSARDVSFTFTCINHLNPSANKTRATKHAFKSSEDWGFSLFLNKEELSRGFSIGNTVTIQIRIQKNTIDEEEVVPLHIADFNDIKKLGENNLDIYETGCEFHWKYQINTLKQINTIQDVLEYIRKERGDEIVGRIRKWRTRLNRTVRPTDKLKNIKSLKKLKKVNKTIKLYFESPEEIQKLPEDIEEIFLIIKYYDPIGKSIESFTLNAFPLSTIDELVPKLLELKNLPSDSEILIFEEINSSIISPIVNRSVNFNFPKNKIANGDILIFQLKQNVMTENYLSINKFMKSRDQSLCTIYFYNFERPFSMEFSEKLSMRDDYHTLRNLIGNRFQLDSKAIETIEIFSQTYTGDPCSVPFKDTDPYLPLNEIVSDKSNPVIYYRIPLSSTPLNDNNNVDDEDDDIILEGTPEEQIEYLKHQILLIESAVDVEKKELDEITAVNTSLIEKKDRLYMESEFKEEGRQCKICMERYWSVILLPCKHQCLCLACASSTMNDCPLCRKKISGTLIPIPFK